MDVAMKIRPQVLVALVGLIAVSGYAMFMGNVEVATGSVGGVTALSMKLMESE